MAEEDCLVLVKVYRYVWTNDNKLHYASFENKKDKKAAYNALKEYVEGKGLSFEDGILKFDSANIVMGEEDNG